MHRATREFLNALLYLTEMATRPTLGNLTGISSRTLHLTQMARLEEQEYLQREKDKSGEWIHQITLRGALAAIGDRQPEAAWRRPWDGTWSVLLFDIPARCRKERRELHAWLRASHFGCLQRSVWISPDPLVELVREIRPLSKHPESVIVLNGSPALEASGSVRPIVKAAWDFDAINNGYDFYLESAKRAKRAKTATARAEEHAAWLDAVNADPLLPDALLPPGYLGRKAWKTRCALYPYLASNAHKISSI